MIELRNISKFYSSEGSMAVGIQNISLTYDIGEFVAITGESGSGKSTLLSVISGLDSYEEGEMLINGQSTSDYTKEDFDRYRNQMVGFVFQNYNLIDSYSVLENVMLPLLAKGMKRADAKRDALAIIAKVGLQARTRHKASKLSGGEKQRTVIARALASGAPIIACDEPTGNLDSQTSKEILELLNDIREDRLVLIVTHDYDAVKPYCTRHTILKDGHIADDRIIAPKGPSTERIIKIEKISNRRNLFDIALSNVIHTPKRTFLSLLMATVTSITILAIIGGFIQTSKNLENLYTNQDVTIYDNKAKNRLVAYPNGAETDTLANAIGSEDVFLDEGNLISDLFFRIENTSIVPTESENEAWTMFNDYLVSVSPEFVLTNQMSLVVGRAPTAANEFAFIIEEGVNFTTAVSKMPGILTNSHWSINNHSSYDGTLTISLSGVTCVGIYTSPDFKNIYFAPSRTMANKINDDYYDYCANDADVMYQMADMTGLVDTIVDGETIPLNTYFYYQPVYDNNDPSTGTIISRNNIVLVDSYYQNKEITLKLYNKIVTIPAADIVYHDFDLGAYFVGIPILFTRNYIKCLLADTGASQSVFVDSASALATIHSNLLDSGFEVYRSDATVQSMDFMYIFGNLYGIVLTVFSFIGYLILGFVTYLVSRLVFMLIYQNKKKDYAILETLGMSKPNLRFINRTETAIVFVASYVVATVALIFITNSPYSLSLVLANPYVLILSLAIIFLFAIFIAIRYEKKLFALTVNKVLKAGDFLD